MSGGPIPRGRVRHPNHSVPFEHQGLALWGQISYDTHMNYTANGVTG